MRITVKFFAIARELAGTAQVELDLPDGSTVASAAEVVGRRFRPMVPHLKQMAYAVNLAYAEDSTELHEGDELALIPPVSGGAEDDLIQLLPTPLPHAQAIAAVGDDQAGGIDIFLGTTRAETDSTGRQLIALDYEAYPEMVMAQFHDFARRAREKWPIRRLAILHRTGRVAVGEPSVLISVACPHRASAFEACRFLIDTLKAEATIWKKEVWNAD